MFDVTPDEVAQLNDTDLRELVGRLCEAELASRGLSPAAVTWGGHQTAADGGLDVRVALPTGTTRDSFVPRASTGFQVKTPDMPKAAILAEMRPTGEIRPAIQKLADEAGAYVMVSSHGSTADRALGNRRDALREALVGVANADQLHTDFYDRTRLATWVRRHPGLITWVKERIGRALVGWRPYGAWSGAAEDVEAEYLFDEKLRLHLGKHRDTPALPVADAIDELRDELVRPGKVVRLVGLSGVGKTRLVQALFDLVAPRAFATPSLGFRRGYIGRKRDDADSTAHHRCERSLGLLPFAASPGTSGAAEVHGRHSTGSGHPERSRQGCRHGGGAAASATPHVLSSDVIVV